MNTKYNDLIKFSNELHNLINDFEKSESKHAAEKDKLIFDLEGVCLKKHRLEKENEELKKNDAAAYWYEEWKTSQTEKSVLQQNLEKAYAELKVMDIDNINSTLKEMSDYTDKLEKENRELKSANIENKYVELYDIAKVEIELLQKQLATAAQNYITEKEQHQLTKHKNIELELRLKGYIDANKFLEDEIIRADARIGQLEKKLNMK